VMRPRFQNRSIFAILIMVSFLFTGLLRAQTSNSAALTVRVVHARNANGVIRVALFQNADGFPGDATKALRAEPAKIDPRTLTAQAIFTGLPQGNYAVLIFHDENGNGKLDKNIFGIPKEGYGASNNPAKKMRAPTFDEAKFSLHSDKIIEVKLIY
jgi:uncharacterized protein (DUF2141 family)